MAPLSLFEIKNNLIWVSWEYNDVEADDSISDNLNGKYLINHKIDGLIIYLVDNNEIIEQKYLEKIILIGKYFFVFLKKKI